MGITFIIVTIKYYYHYYQ